MTRKISKLTKANLVKKLRSLEAQKDNEDS